MEILTRDVVLAEIAAFGISPAKFQDYHSSDIKILSKDRESVLSCSIKIGNEKKPVLASVFRAETNIGSLSIVHGDKRLFGTKSVFTFYVPYFWSLNTGMIIRLCESNGFGINIDVRDSNVKVEVDLNGKSYTGESRECVTNAFIMALCKVDLPRRVKALADQYYRFPYPEDILKNFIVFERESNGMVGI